MTVIRILVAAVPAIAAAGTLLSLSRNPHWLFRLFDFPRVQIALCAAAGGFAYWRWFYGGLAAETALLAAAALATGWQVYKILPYTPLGRKQVASARTAAPDDPNRFSLLVSNVLMENEDHGRLIETIRQEAPDLVLAVETNQRWATALEELDGEYPHRVRCPQENYYGMILLSRLELVKPAIRYLVQEDIPSIHAGVRLRSGVEITLHGIHPRPPEPLRDQISAPRDAELVLLGREIEKGGGERAVVAGDLNDVAWSDTSQLFVRLSGLLDPRVGRGFFNSYNANNPFFRFPLDHVFHAKTFRLISLRRLKSIGSDHFPILIELLHSEDAPADQAPPEKKSGDREQAREIVQKEREAKAAGKDRPNDD